MHIFILQFHVFKCFLQAIIAKNLRELFFERKVVMSKEDLTILGYCL